MGAEKYNERAIEAIKEADEDAIAEVIGKAKARIVKEGLGLF